MPTPRFALIGVGYVAEKHLRAIKAVGGVLVVACDIASNVGVLDRYFPECEFYANETAFWNRVAVPQEANCAVDWVTVATPNNVHDPHVTMAMQLGHNVLIEKPPTIARYSRRAGESRLYPVFQLRHIPSIRNHSGRNDEGRPRQVRIVYHAPRGDWYRKTWKGDPRQSGGILLNLGSHLLDLCHWLWGHDPRIGECSLSEDFYFGVHYHPDAVVSVELASTGEAQRTMLVDGHEFDLSPGLDLHTEVYRAALRGERVPLEDVAAVLRTVERIKEKAK
jgi:UDP-N-acetyl-2-amino-2-deoxyglucuronate dehydrogenase